MKKLLIYDQYEGKKIRQENAIIVKKEWKKKHMVTA